MLYFFNMEFQFFKNVFVKFFEYYLLVFTFPLILGEFLRDFYYWYVRSSLPAFNICHFLFKPFHPFCYFFYL